MSKTWFTSDLHFGHARVIEYCNRPFETVEEMNEQLILNWNAVVAQDDVVYVLGDFSMNAASVERNLPRLNGRKRLILGNHDFPHPAHQKGRKPDLRAKWTEAYLRYGFESVELEGTFNIEGVANFRMYHLPYSSADDTHQDGKPRHFKERLPDDGVPLLCGHVHEKWAFKRTDKGTPQLNVGVDSPYAPWYMRPASLEEITAFYLEATKS